MKGDHELTQPPGVLAPFYSKLIGAREHELDTNSTGLAGSWHALFLHEPATRQPVLGDEAVEILEWTELLHRKLDPGRRALWLIGESNSRGAKEAEPSEETEQIAHRIH